jgi:hypothetical protein
MCERLRRDPDVETHLNIRHLCLIYYDNGAGSQKYESWCFSSGVSGNSSGRIFLH